MRATSWCCSDQSIPQKIFTASFLRRRCRVRSLCGPCGDLIPGLDPSAISPAVHGTGFRQILCLTKSSLARGAKKRFLLPGWLPLQPRGVVRLWCEVVMVRGHRVCRSVSRLLSQKRSRHLPGVHAAVTFHGPCVGAALP